MSFSEASSGAAEDLARHPMFWTEEESLSPISSAVVAHRAKGAKGMYLLVDPMGSDEQGGLGSFDVQFDQNEGGFVRLCQLIV